MARLAAVALCLALATAACLAATTGDEHRRHQHIARHNTAAHYESMFHQFKKRFHKHYSSAEEENSRFQVFVENMKIAEARRLQNPLASFGPNKFADRSAQEFKNHHNLEKFVEKRQQIALEMAPPISPAQLAAWPKSIDWRTKGAVTEVKNQGECGSCYTFSTTGSIEGQWALAGNPLTSLSEQELVSCDDIDDGCNGGFQDDAFIWLLFERKGAIATEASYPYVSGNGVVPNCTTTGLVTGAVISGYQDIARDEKKMAEHCGANGPVAICLDATSFQLYQGGILTNCVNQTVDHAVLIVGYDLTNSPPYWIVKNSWGADWGEQGYIRIAYGSDQCLIAANDGARRGEPVVHVGHDRRSVDAFPDARAYPRPDACAYACPHACAYAGADDAGPHDARAV